MNKKSLLLTILLIGTFLLSSKVFAQSPNPQNDSKNPKPASASVYNLGLKSYEQGDTTSAITFFKRAIDIDPDFVDAYFNLGAIYKKQKSYYNAIQAFQKVVDLSPEDNEAVFELASCYLEDKKYEKAKQYFSSIPPDYSKYNDAKQNIEKANKYMTIDNAVASGDKEIIQAPETQAQLLADQLGKSVQSPEEISESTKQKPAESTGNKGSHEELLAKTITKPPGEAIGSNIRTITGNFNGPAGIAKDSKNNLYIVNFIKNRIDKLIPGGKREVFIEKLGLDGPIGLTIDDQDNLYVANYTGDSIVKISPDKTISILVDKVTKPYYLYLDPKTNKLYATLQGNDSLVEIDTRNSNEPITSR